MHCTLVVRRSILREIYRQCLHRFQVVQKGLDDRRRAHPPYRQPAAPAFDKIREGARQRAADHCVHHPLAPHTGASHETGYYENDNVLRARLTFLNTRQDFKPPSMPTCLARAGPPDRPATLTHSLGRYKSESGHNCPTVRHQSSRGRSCRAERILPMPSLSPAHDENLAAITLPFCGGPELRRSLASEWPPSHWVINSPRV